MEHRRLGTSGLKVPVLSFGAATFGAGSDFFRAWGDTDVDGARRLVDICLDAGVTMFDTADAYSRGRSEEILGEALAGRRDRVLISTKATTPMGDGPNEGGSSRYHLVDTVEQSLRRLRTDHIDLLYMHEFDATTAVEEVVHTLDDLVTAGKVRYVGASNFSGWQLMKALALADRTAGRATPPIRSSTRSRSATTSTSSRRSGSTRASRRWSGARSAAPR